MSHVDLWIFLTLWFSRCSLSADLNSWSLPLFVSSNFLYCVRVSPHHLFYLWVISLHSPPPHLLDISDTFWTIIKIPAHLSNRIMWIILSPVQIVFWVGLRPTISRSSPVLRQPCSMRPLATVPLPDMEKVSSTGIRKGFSVSLLGVGIDASTWEELSVDLVNNKK